MQTAINSRISRNRTLLRGALALTILTVVLTALVASFHLHRLAERRNAVTTQNMTRSIEQTIEGLLDTIDVTLLAAADEIGRLSPHPADARAVTAILQRHLQRVPGLSYLRATNARGDVVFGTGVLSPPNNISDRDYFAQLRNPANAGALLSRHLIGRIAGDWAWLFVRRINNADGSFAGVVFAGVLTKRIEALFSQFQLGSGGSITLRDSGLSLLARHATDSPVTIPYGDRRLSTPFVEALRANPDEGDFVSDASSLDGISRFHAYRRNAKYGFLTNVGTVGEDALAEWHKQMLVLGALAAALISISLVFAVLISRAWRRQEHDMAIISRSQQELREAEKIANIGRYSYDLPDNRWTSSEILDGIFGIDDAFPRDAEHWLELVAADSRQEMREYLQAVLAQEIVFDHEYRIVRANDGELRWVHGQGKLLLDAHGQPTRLIGTIQDVTERRRMEDQVRQLAFYDPLTGLANRRLLDDRLRQNLAACKRSGNHGALLFIDLDSFKPLNDRYGHHIGDLLLSEAARRLSRSIRQMDSVSRLGGDEFVVVIGELGSDYLAATTQASAVAEKIRAALAEPYALAASAEKNADDASVYWCTSSIGMFVFNSNSGDQELLLRRADQSMYLAKAAGGNRVHVFAPSAPGCTPTA